MGIVTDPFTFSNGTVADALQVNARIAAILAQLNGNVDNTNVAAGANIDGAKLLAASVPDAQLASPTNSVWRPILTADVVVGAGAVAGTNYWFAGVTATPSGTGAPVSSGVPVLWLPATAADVAVGAKTTRLRLRVVLAVNAAAPGVTVTPGFYPISAFAGGSGTTTPTLGAAALTATFAAPAAGSGNSGVSATADLSSLNPATTYCFGASVSGTVAAGSVCVLHMALEMRHT